MEVGYCSTPFVYVWDLFYTLCSVRGWGIVAISLNNRYVHLSQAMLPRLREMNRNGYRWGMGWTIKQQTESNDFCIFLSSKNMISAPPKNMSI